MQLLREKSEVRHGHAYLTGKRRLDPEWAPGTAILAGTAVELTLCQKDITLATVCDALQTNKVLAQLAWNVPWDFITMCMFEFNEKGTSTWSKYEQKNFKISSNYRTLYAHR